MATLFRFWPLIGNGTLAILRDCLVLFMRDREYQLSTRSSIERRARLGKVTSCVSEEVVVIKFAFIYRYFLSVQAEQKCLKRISGRGKGEEAYVETWDFLFLFVSTFR